MAGTDRDRLFSRLQELHSQQGKGWNEIAEILKKEGYEEKGKALTGNALRKRYTKWSRTEEVVSGKPLVASEPETNQEHGGVDFDWLQKNRMDSALKQFQGGGSVPTASPEDAIAGLVALNHQLMEQIQESNRLMQRLEKRFEEQELKTAHTGVETEQPVTSRDLLELLKEFGAGRQQMQYIEEERKGSPSREEVQDLIDGIVEEKVESELKTMLSGEGSFSRELTHLIDQRLKNLFSGGEPVGKTAHAGPGRGKKGRTHKKFSASLEESLFERVKNLPGQFSGHLSNALEAYLSVMGQKGAEE